jgi:hypothetical protein
LLPEGFAEDLYKRQDGRCAVTGVRFSLEPSFPKALVKHPMAPSIDRRLSTGGYTKSNVRLVCVAVNFGMGQWGEETYLTLARAAVGHSQKKGIDTETEWHAAVRERLEAAEKLLPLLPERSAKEAAPANRRLQSRAHPGSSRGEPQGQKGVGHYSSYLRPVIGTARPCRYCWSSSPYYRSE